MKQEKTIISSRPLARVSLKDSNTIFQKIRNKPIKKSKTLLNQLLDQKINIDGRYFTKASKEILELIEDAEKNADAKGLNTDKLFVKQAVANKSFRYYLPKSRFSHRGRRAKICQLKIIIEER